MMYKQLPLAVGLRVDATFDNFYISEENQQTLSALRHFCESANEHFFFLSGREGSGVTHLLQAVQHQLTDRAIQFLPLKEFIHYLPGDVLQGLEHLDLIVIDDLHLVIGEEDWELALFHLYNRLRDNGKQLLVGSHIAARELPVCLPDLQSRLQWGMAYHLQLLNDDDKKQVLAQRAAMLGLNLSDEVSQFILNHCSRDTQQLIQLLSALDKASLAEQRQLTIPFIKQVVAA